MTSERQSEMPAFKPQPQAEWLKRYLWSAVLIDGLLGAIALLIGWFAHHSDGPLTGTQAAIAAVAVPAWILVLAAADAYDPRSIGAGTDEYRHVLNAGLVMLASVSTASFFLRLDITRSFVAWSVPVAVALTVVGRFAHRKNLHRRRARGLDVRRTLLIGSRDEVVLLAEHLDAAPWAGFQIVGACRTGAAEPSSGDDDAMPVLDGTPDEVCRALLDVGADTLIIASAASLGPVGLRELTWQLEGSGINLAVAPVVSDISGPRISSRPVAGLPLLHVETPRLALQAKVFKAVFDRVVALGALLLASPVMLVAAVLIKVTSKGPVLFRQTRVGLDGKPFVFVKFRTMVVDAERRLDELARSNEADGPLFKLRDDPRCTPVGRYLRRFSIDELPQLFQVLAGTMSIVGPRPPLPSEVETYDHHVHRKFLVKPGITGLWQVNGRSDLSWDEAVRLDLYYVDNWSPTMDLVICLKTVTAVVRLSGAY